MDIATTKLELMNLLLREQKESVLKKIKTIFDENGSDWYDELSYDEQKEIELGIQQADSGKLIDHTEVKDRFKKWH